MFITNQIFQSLMFVISIVLIFNNILNTIKQISYTFTLVISKSLILNIKNDRSKIFNITQNQQLIKTRIKLKNTIK